MPVKRAVEFALAFMLSVSPLLAASAGCRAHGEHAVYSGDISARQGLSSFDLVGDTQRTSRWEFWRAQNDKARNAVLKKIASDNPAFVIHLGDLVFRGSSESRWEQFDKCAAGIHSRGIPVFPVLGNHEHYGNNPRALDNYFRRFPHLEKRKWMAFRFRSVGIIFLDSSLRDLRKDEVAEQCSWYLAKLAEFQNDPAVTTVLVVCHRPPYTNSRIVHASKGVESMFVKPFDTTPKAKLFFSGHAHAYEHFVYDGKHFVVSGGGGAPRHLVGTDPNKRRFNDVYAGGPLRDFHFCRVSVTDEGVRVQMVRLDKTLSEWSIGDEFVVR